MSGSRNSGWLKSRFSPLMKAVGVSAAESTSMAKAAMTEVMPKLRRGLCELIEHPDKYRQYEPANGWGTLEGAKKCIASWIHELEDDGWDGPTWLWPIEALWWRW